MKLKLVVFFKLIREQPIPVIADIMEPVGLLASLNAQELHGCAHTLEPSRMTKLATLTEAGIGEKISSHLI